MSVTLSPSHQIKPSPGVVNSIYWNTALPMYLQIAYGCFCTVMAALSSCDRDLQVCKV